MRKPKTDRPKTTKNIKNPNIPVTAPVYAWMKST